MDTINYASMTDEQILQLCQDERSECENWTRVMGYFRPKSQFNKGKQSEYEERTWFVESIAAMSAPHCCCMQQAA